jgi:hypothetical protein
VMRVARRSTTWRECRYSSVGCWERERGRWKMLRRR